LIVGSKACIGDIADFLASHPVDQVFDLKTISARCGVGWSCARRALHRLKIGYIKDPRDRRLLFSVAFSPAHNHSADRRAKRLLFVLKKRGALTAKEAAELTGELPCYAYRFYRSQGLISAAISHHGKSQRLFAVTQQALDERIKKGGSSGR
jgi:hypothetical protein